MKLFVTKPVIIMMCVAASCNFMFAFALSAQKKAVQDDRNPAAVLAYANSVLELNNLYIQALSNFEKVIASASNNIQLLRQNPEAEPVPVDYSSIIVDRQTLAQYSAKIKGGPSFPEKSVILEAVKQASGEYDKVAQNCGNISDYFSKASYKNDGDFSTYLGLVNSVYDNIKNSYIGWYKVSSMAVKVAGKAETDVLQNSKAGEFIIPMKNDLASLAGLFGMYSREFVDFADVDQQCNAVQQSLNKNKNTSNRDVGKLSASYKELYDSFYGNAQECLSDLRTALEKKSTFSEKPEEKNPGGFDGNKPVGKAAPLAIQDNSEGMEEAYSKAEDAYHAATDNYNQFIVQ